MKLRHLYPILLTLIFMAGTAIHPQKTDPSTIDYEKGISAYLQNDQERAGKSLERAVTSSGESSEMARIALIRTVALRSGLGGIRPLLETGESDLAPALWFAAIHALIEGERTGEAEELAIEFPLKFPDSDLNDNVEYALADIFFKKGHLRASLDRLIIIIERYPQGDTMDDAYYLLSRIFGIRGEFYAPSREYQIVTAFVGSSRPIFRDSIHMASMKERLHLLRSGFRRLSATE
jgi:outer membrane protein assembly factor BamD (BamD/ComL family)